ncbi:MAG: hypothetical protein OXE41_11185 [Gammaproteobacteria bacterium]|nr:hypothetical protein [Gammaproteobacteria bacterium]MCY4275935.1 hypothetical protein [Gammaproteobacteria bacterium]
MSDKNQSQREILRLKMLEEAQSRPGVREAMEVYQKFHDLQLKNSNMNIPQSLFTNPEKATMVTSSTVSIYLTRTA